MVDFQERDTSRGLEELGDATQEDSGEHDEHGHDVDHGGHHHHDVEAVGVAVLTVSSTRTIEEDDSGEAIASALEDAGHEIVTRDLVGDDHDDVQRAVDALVRRDDVDAVVSTGGTGVTPDDETIEAVRPLLEKHLPGFGELFRRRSEADVGTRVIGTRATAGVADGAFVFCLPGSESAARLGVRELIVPEIGHLVGLAGRDRDGDEESSERGAEGSDAGG